MRQAAAVQFMHIKPTEFWDLTPKEYNTFMRAHQELMDPDGSIRKAAKGEVPGKTVITPELEDRMKVLMETL